MTVDRRAFLAFAAATAALPSRLRAAGGNVLTPEQFGAKGDGVTNDTAAFGRLSDAVNRRGGGTISLRAGRTYIVGAQVAGGRPMPADYPRRGGPPLGWDPDPILDLHQLTAPLTIFGNGARLRAQPGLRYGTFDLASDQPVEHPMPYTKNADVAGAYRGMIWIRDCRGPIAIHDVELDGNIERLRIGGKFGDKGWQIPAVGLHLERNLASELVDNVLTHHHGLDGIEIRGAPDRAARSRYSRVVARYNGRQGLSFVGGSGYDFVDCEFSHTGRSILKSPPGAGVDLEAEGKGTTIRDLTFTRCKFIDNSGAGVDADSGNSEGVRFNDCLFVGTTNWTGWLKKPRMSFAGCTFVGSIVHAFGDPDPARAAHFTSCTFTDDPRLSPTGQVFTDGTIANVAQAENVLFDTCTFRLVGEGVLPTSRGAIYKDCVMSQRSQRMAQTKGRFLGRTTISGPVNISGSMVEGTLILNGSRVPPGQV